MPSVDRVLPWRRSVVTQPPSDVLQPLLTVFRERQPKADPSLIIKAFHIADEAHGGQFRRSGEPYINHPLSVASILAGLGLDDVTIAAALLHDAVEDTGITIEDLETEFGQKIALLVDGVTKLERVRFESKEAQQAATMRK